MGKICVQKVCQTGIIALTFYVLNCNPNASTFTFPQQITLLDKLKLQVQNFTKEPNNKTIFDIIGVQSLSLSDANFSTLQNTLNISGGQAVFEKFTIGEITTFLNFTQEQGLTITIKNLLQSFDTKLNHASILSKQPVVIAAFKKGININQILLMTVIDLAEKVTGFTIPIMQKLYSISNKDLASAKALKFGHLPSYVYQTIKIQFHLNHFLTMSLDSITRAMLIHKNETEGTIDFIKDFKFIATTVTIREIKAVYNISNATVSASSVFSLSNAISGIDLSQFVLAMGGTPGFNLTVFSIGEIADHLKLSNVMLETMTLFQLRSQFAMSLYPSVAPSLQPVAIASYRKGITINEISRTGIIDLAVRLTGLSVPVIKKLYRISDNDLATAVKLRFGDLSGYVNRTMGVQSQLKHFLTMSMNSIVRGMVIHKNQTEGIIDFIKDFRVIATTVTIREIKAVYNISNATVNASSVFSLSNAISGIDLSQFVLAMGGTPGFNLTVFSIGEIADHLKLSNVMLETMTLFQLRSQFAMSLYPSVAPSSQPVAIAGYRKGITINEISRTGIIDLAVRLTGLSVPVIKKLYRISDNDLATAVKLRFGDLSGYVNRTMGVQSQLKHFLTMSMNSIVRAMLIHKNQTEGTIDFIKDFKFIATTVTIREIKAVYNISNATVSASSVFSLSNAISGIDLSQFVLAMGGTPGFNLTVFSIGEIADHLKLSNVMLETMTLLQLRSQFAMSLYPSVAPSLQPVAIASYRKGITINEISRTGIIDLAVRLTGLSVPVIKKLYRISDNDLATAVKLRFGDLSGYVNRTMGVQSQLKHFLTMSMNSITRAMLIHKNQTEGTIDFIKDFKFIATTVTIREIKAVYNISNATVNASSVFSLSNAISGIDLSQFVLAMGGTPGFNLTVFSIGEIADHLKLSNVMLETMTLFQLRSQFAMSLYPSVAPSLQPVAIAGYRKGITINEISRTGIIDLAVRLTGLSVPVIKKLYRISDNDLATAVKLRFGDLSGYVNRTMGVQSQLKHFLTMSMNSIVRGMVIHKNQTEGTIDFIKDFKFIAATVTIREIKAVYNISNATVSASSVFSLSNAISGIDLSQFTSALGSIPGVNLTVFSIGEIAQHLKLSNVMLEKMTLANLRGHFAALLVGAYAPSRLPVSIVAFRKGITINEISRTGIIDLAVRLTGLSVPVIKKLYRISDNDLATAVKLRFGDLSGYVNRTMGVQSQLKHFLTMSMNSIVRGMVIHKNQTEGIIDFIKDFRVIATTVTIREIKAVYNISNATVNASSVFSLSNAISGIDLSQFVLAMGGTPGFNLTVFSIGEIADHLKLSNVMLETMTLFQLRSQFAMSLYPSVAPSSQPVAIAGYRKGITINEISRTGIIDLAVRLTGLSVPVIKKLYRISDNDLATAVKLRFGDLSGYVNRTMGVQSQLKHFLTMSMNSIVRGMVIHKNQTEGTIDFIKDFKFIATTVTIREIKAVYNISNATVNASSVFSLSNAISGIDLSQFTSALGSIPGVNLTVFSIGEIAQHLKLSNVMLEKMTLANLRGQFAALLAGAYAPSRLPVSIAAFRKGITINEISRTGIIDLAVRLTGLSVPVIKKLYRISDNDLATAVKLRFGDLSGYVNRTMGVQSQLKHFLTMSMNSIVRGMVIHKNQTEGIIDFIKDFRVIATTVTIREIKAVYNISNATVNASSVFSLSNAISGIDLSQFVLAMGGTPGFNLTVFSIGEIADHLKLSNVMLETMTLFQLRSQFAMSLYPSVAPSLQPVAIASYRKGITINEISRTGIIDLAVRLTGLSVPVIKKLYRISDNDLATASTLLFGSLPSFVNKTTNVLFELKHFNVMSLDSIYRAFLVHKDIVKGRIDFKKDVNTLMSGIDMETVSKVFSIDLETIKQGTLNSLLDRMAGTNLSDVTNYSAKQIFALGSFTLAEGLSFLLSRGEHIAFEKMILSKFMQSIIIKSQVVSGFFESLNNLVSGNLMQTSILTLTMRANLTESVVHPLLVSSFISVNYYERIKNLTLNEAISNRILSISSQNIEQKTLMKVLQSIRNFKGMFKSFCSIYLHLQCNAPM